MANLSQPVSCRRGAWQVWSGAECGGIVSVVFVCVVLSVRSCPESFSPACRFASPCALFRNAEVTAETLANGRWSCCAVYEKNQVAGQCWAEREDGVCVLFRAERLFQTNSRRVQARAEHVAHSRAAMRSAGCQWQDMCNYSIRYYTIPLK